MNRQQRTRFLLYLLISICALVSTGAQLEPYLELGLVGGNARFWQETMVTAASRFMTMDVMFVFLVIWWWMLTEARRLKMANVGWYFPAAVLISFSATLPIFMLHRELALSRTGDAAESSHMRRLDRLSVLMVAGAALAYAFNAWRWRH